MVQRIELTQKPIGELIREVREEKGISQRALKIRTGIAQKTISRIENGLDSPRVVTLEKIASALDLRIVIERIETDIEDEGVKTIV